MQLKRKWLPCTQEASHCLKLKPANGFIQSSVYVTTDLFEPRLDLLVSATPPAKTERLDVEKERRQLKLEYNTKEKIKTEARVAELDVPSR